MCPYNPYHEPELKKSEVSNQIANASGLVTVTTELRVVRDSWVEFEPSMNVTHYPTPVRYQESGSKVDVLFMDQESGLGGGTERVAQSADISGGKVVVYARGDR